MPKRRITLDNFKGISTLFSTDSGPIAVLRTLINLRPDVKLGSLVKRGGYTSKLAAGLTSLKQILEFENKNGETLLMLMDGNTLEESVNTSGSYASVSAISNDERTAGSTIDGDCFSPVVVNKEIRAGAGNSASTERPIWYGYHGSKSRYNSAVSVSDGRYLDLQDYKGIIKSTFLSDVNPSVGSNTNSSGGYSSANGKHLIAYASPVIDGYQRGFPFLLSPFVEGTDFPANTLYTNTNLDLEIKIATANASLLKRITSIDIFVAQVNTKDDWENNPAYFVGRIDMNSQGEYFLEQTGTLSSGSSNITIASAADWHTVSLNEVWCYDSTNDKTYLIDTDLDSSGSRVLTVRAEGDSITDNGAASLHFFTGWFSQGGFYWYYFKADNFYFPQGAEMYDYLNIPVGDVGIPDFRYKYMGWNGFRAIYGGFPEDDNFSYMSVVNNPDVVPSQNIYRHKSAVKGYSTVDQDYLVFTKTGIERLSFVGSGLVDQNDEYLDAVLASEKSIVKINDNQVAFMAFNGAYLVSDRRVIFIGRHLEDWWKDNITKAQMEACVAGYNDRNNEIWFSFPTYTTAPFTTGLIVAFSLDAYESQLGSGWWLVKTDTPVTCFSQNDQRNLLAGGATEIVDFDANGSESFDTLYRLKLFKNAIPGRKVRWDRLFVDSITDDTITCTVYFDRSTSGVTISLNSDLNGFMRYMKETFEVEVYTSASANSVVHEGLQATFSPMEAK